MTFTTRPQLAGTFGMVATTHWIASAVGMRMLEAGGAAGDAAVAAGFALNVVEPHLNGPLGDMPALVWPADEDAPQVICGQGVAPARATIEHYRAEGLRLIPGSGLLATVVPGAFDAWMLMLRDHGRLSLRAVMEPAIHLAEAGHPILARVCETIAGQAEFFAREWPSSAAVWLPGGRVPVPGTLFRNPDLAAFWRRLLTEAEAAGAVREAQIEAARRAFYEGFVAEAIDDHVRRTEAMDATGQRRKGVLTADDMAAWRASVEPPVGIDTRAWSVWKCGPWSQGPVLLQCLRLLEGDLPPSGSAAFVHRVTEAIKLSFADRDAFYGDAEVDLPRLLSPVYNGVRRRLIGEEASLEQRPGNIDPALARAFIARVAMAQAEAEALAEAQGGGAGAGAGEPTMAHLNREGDTCHVDVIDRWGNAVSCTPSGGWLQSNPVVEGLGVPLNTRAQMFWLEPGLPSSLIPGKRPRTTLTPSMARDPDGGRLAFGTPGGDQQDQWQLIMLLRLMHETDNLQEAIDGPLFHTGHVQASFYPRGARPGHLMTEPAFGDAVAQDLRGRGHRLEISEPWAVGRLTATRRRADGVLHGAATPRLMQAYAVGR